MFIISGRQTESIRHNNDQSLDGAINNKRSRGRPRKTEREILIAPTSTTKPATAVESVLSASSSVTPSLHHEQQLDSKNSDRPNYLALIEEHMEMVRDDKEVVTPNGASSSDDGSSTNIWACKHCGAERKETKRRGRSYHSLLSHLRTCVSDSIVEDYEEAMMHRRSSYAPNGKAAMKNPRNVIAAPKQETTVHQPVSDNIKLVTPNPKKDICFGDSCCSGYHIFQECVKMVRMGVDQEDWENVAIHQTLYYLENRKVPDARFLIKVPSGGWREATQQEVHRKVTTLYRHYFSFKAPTTTKDRSELPYYETTIRQKVSEETSKPEENRRPGLFQHVLIESPRCELPQMIHKQTRPGTDLHAAVMPEAASYDTPLPNDNGVGDSGIFFNGPAASCERLPPGIEASAVDFVRRPPSSANNKRSSRNSQGDHPLWEPAPKKSMHYSEKRAGAVQFNATMQNRISAKRDNGESLEEKTRVLECDLQELVKWRKEVEKAKSIRTQKYELLRARQKRYNELVRQAGAENAAQIEMPELPKNAATDLDTSETDTIDRIVLCQKRVGELKLKLNALDGEIDWWEKQTVALEKLLKEDEKTTQYEREKEQEYLQMEVKYAEEAALVYTLLKDG